MTFLIPLLGLRVQRHSGTISVFLRIMMAIFIRNLRIIRTYRLILKPNMFPRLKVRFELGDQEDYQKSISLP